MKPALLALLIVIATSFSFATDDAGRIVGGVEAVLHEGIVTFTVVHPEAVSASVKVFDLESDGLIFDSGPRARTQVTWLPGHDFAGGFRYLVTAWNAEGEVVVSQTAANKTQTPISEISFDNIPDNTSVVGPGEIDLLGDVNIGTVPGVGLYRDYGGLGYGGSVVVYGDSTFDKRVYMSADSAAGAGYFRLSGKVGGFWIDGSQHLHGNEPAMSFYGGTSEFQFYAGETGTDSVVMPADAVSATEIENEPGVASKVDITWRTLGNTFDFMAGRTITAPTDGFVLAMGDTRARLDHYLGDESHVVCVLSGPGFPGGIEDRRQFTIPSTIPTGTWYTAIHVRRIFPVTAGVFTVSLYCLGGPNDQHHSDNNHLDLAFFPTAYGVVDTAAPSTLEGLLTTQPLPDGQSSGITPSEIEAERAESIAFNLARIQSELDAIQARADALAAEIDE